MEYDADVGVVGAGFGGLAAALTVRRHRHSALVFDGGPCRNAWAQELHCYLGLFGRSGDEVRELAMDQVRGAGGDIEPARISNARRSGDGFRVAAEDGREWTVRRLVLATGVRDILPEVDRFDEFWGCSVHVCPHCDGYEVRDQPVAVVAWNEATLPFTLKLTQWTQQITVVTDGHEPALDVHARAALAEHRIRLLTGDVREFVGEHGQLRALRFADGSTLPVTAAFFNLGQHHENGLAKQLGCELVDGKAVKVDGHQRTTVDGVWAVGDIAGEEQMVAVAAAQGVKAGIDVFRSLPLPTGEPVP